MKNLKRQDRNGTRTSEELRRRYNLNQIELTSDEVEYLKQFLVVDSYLSTTSEHAVQNKVITKALNTKASIESLDTKVNKEEGKGLSTNDFTTTLLNKLNGIAENAKDNVIESISVNGTPQIVKNKNVDIQVSSGGGTSTEVIDNLTSTSTTSALSANQGRVLNEKTNTSLIRVGISNNLTISKDYNRVEYKLPLDKVRYSQGNFTFDASTNEIVVGKNINVILVNVQLYFYSTVDITYPKIIYIRRNTNASGTISSRLGLSLKQTNCITSAIVPVVEGDRIKIGVTANENDVISNNSTMCFVEAVKIS